MPFVVSRICKPKPAGRKKDGRETSVLATRTVSPFLHSCLASGETSSFLPASALYVAATMSCDSRRREHAMRPIDVCHPNELRAPAPRVFPIRCHDFRHVDTVRILGSVRLDRRTWAFHAPEPASMDRWVTRPSGLTAWTKSIGPAATWTFSFHGAFINRISGIPVASFPSTSFQFSDGRVRKVPRST